MLMARMSSSAQSVSIIRGWLSLLSIGEAWQKTNTKNIAAEEIIFLIILLMYTGNVTQFPKS